MRRIINPLAQMSIGLHSLMTPLVGGSQKFYVVEKALPPTNAYYAATMHRFITPCYKIATGLNYGVEHKPAPLSPL